MSRVVVLRQNNTGYPDKAPFHPPSIFPELGLAGIRAADPGNGVYSAVRDALALFGLDRDNFGTPEWNPLGTYVRRGDKVVIKPNFVLHEFGAQLGANCLTTHGAVLRAVLDYVYLAAGPEGKIVVADAPLQGADFERVISTAGLRQIQEFYNKELRSEIEIIDLRQVHAIIDEASSLIRRVERLPGDPLGYDEVDLGQKSRLNELDQSHPFYVVGDYDAAVTNLRHRHPRHEYVISRTILEADALICVPKLKTHSKAGLTVCLKNLVGIIGSKDCLPHHRHGKASRGGDEFPEDYPARWLWSSRVYALLQGRVPQVIWRIMRSFAQTALRAGTPINGSRRLQHSSFFPSGGWHGNDTIWRVVDDLNRALFFYDNQGRQLTDKPQRKYFAVVDGIVAMEGNGPLRGSPKHCGLILGGDDPLAVDVVGATLMGFDWQRIRMLKGIADSERGRAYSRFRGDESAIDLVSNCAQWDSLDAVRREHLGFQPAAGWLGFVEQKQCGESESMTVSHQFSRM